MGKLGALGRLLLPVGYQLAALPLCAVLASAASPALASPLGGDVVAGPAGAQIAITASGAAHIGEVGARQRSLSNNQTPAGVPETTTAAETGAPEPGAEAFQNREDGLRFENAVDAQQRTNELGIERAERTDQRLIEEEVEGSAR